MSDVKPMRELTREHRVLATWKAHRWTQTARSRPTASGSCVSFTARSRWGGADMDALHEFAGLAANALKDITDPDATLHAADEALAALEQHVSALPREYRCAGKLVARCLYKQHSKDYSDPCEASATLTYLRAAFIWSHTSYMAASLMKAGEEVGMARAATDAITRDKLELRTVLRAVVNAVEQSIVEMACEKMHGRAA